MELSLEQIKKNFAAQVDLIESVGYQRGYKDGVAFGRTGKILASEVEAMHQVCVAVSEWVEAQEALDDLKDPPPKGSSAPFMKVVLCQQRTKKKLAELMVLMSLGHLPSSEG